MMFSPYLTDKRRPDILVNSLLDFLKAVVIMVVSLAPLVDC